MVKQKQGLKHFSFVSASFRKLEKKFDLYYYYDGLARQDEEIRLTVGKKLQQCPLTTIYCRNRAAKT